MASLRTRLFVTLLYSWTFGFPLTTAEWVRRLYRSKKTAAVLPNTTELYSEIVSLHQQKLLSKDGPYFVPLMMRADTNATELSPSTTGSPRLSAHARLQRHAIAQQKKAEIAPVVRFCRYIPWVAGVALTGSVAVNNAQKNDDVDFMIVCAPHRLWLVRPLLIFFSQLYGKRRTWQGEEGNSWCFNLWLEQHDQGVPLGNRSLYTAYEVCQAQWVVSKAYTRELFLSDNRWVMAYVPLLYAQAQQWLATFETTAPLFRLPIIGFLLDFANYISFLVQHAYMRRHMTREHVVLHMAAFHPRDTRMMIVERMTTLLAASIK